SSLRAFYQLRPQLFGKKLRNLVLNGKVVVQWVVGCVRPQIMAAGGIEEIRDHAHFVAQATHTARNNQRSDQSLRSLPHCRLRIARVWRIPRDQPYRLYSGNYVDDLVSQPVAEIA